MNRLSRLIGAVGQARSAWDAAFLKNIALGIDQDVVDNPYGKSDLVYICISTTARAISQVPLIVEQCVKDDYEPVPEDNPWQVLFDSPNYLADKYKFVEGLISYLLLSGHVWAVPFPPGQSGTVPDSLWVVSRKFMSPVRDSNGQLAGWNYSAKGNGQRTIRLAPEDVISIRLWNPNDPIMGQSPLDAGKIAIQTDYRAAYYNAQFFKNGATASGVLSTKERLSDKQYQRLKEQTQSRHVGYRDAHKLMILEQGLQFSQTSLTHHDMEFYNLRKFDQERILQIFGMKKAIVSVTDDLNYATAREQRKEWWQDTNLPLMRLILSAFNSYFFVGTDYRLVFDISSIEALHEDFSDKVKTAEILAKLGFTANEINSRLELGFENKPWRDYAYIPISVIPVGDNAPVTPSSGEDGDKIIDVEKVADENILLLKSDRDRALEATWKGFVRRLSPIESRLESNVKRIFYSMRKKALKLLYQKTVDDLSNELFAEESEEIAKVGGRAHSAALETAIAGLANEVGMAIDLDLTDPVVVHFLEKKKLKIKGVVDTVKKHLNRELVAGVTAGESVDDIAERVRNVFNVSVGRAKTIARTETVGAANFGRHEGIVQSGFEEVEWFTALDERVRGLAPGDQYSHIDMHGIKKKVGVPWVVDGDSIMYPGDPNGAPGNVINCRCIEVVVPESLE